MSMGTDAPLVPIGAAEFKAGMALLAGAVNIVTTQGPTGPAGFTATAICSVSAEPPMLLVCLNTGSSAAPAFESAGTLCVNTVTTDLAGVAQLFGGKTPMADRFGAARWNTALTGAPVLQEALVAFEARIVRVQPVATHRVLFCEVVAVHQGDPSAGASLYWNRGFHALAPAGG